MLTLRKFNSTKLAVFECYINKTHSKFVHRIRFNYHNHKINHNNNNNKHKLLSNSHGQKMQCFVQLRYKQQQYQEDRQTQLQEQTTKEALKRPYVGEAFQNSRTLIIKTREENKDLPEPTPPNKAVTAAMNYDIKWIYVNIKNPSLLWYISSQITVFLVGIFSKFLLLIMNRTQVYNKRRLVDIIWRRPRGVPLITVSNHHSCFDDPGLWGILPIRIVCNTFKIRWALAANDICFTNKWHSLFFMNGKCIPVVRGYGVYQEAVDVCIQKMSQGLWVHVFPEGRVNVDKEEIRLKWGVGRMIYESPKIPIIVPIWHEGMDDVLPNVEPYRFCWGKKVTFNVGEHLDLNGFIEDLKARNVPEPEARKRITDKIQTVLYNLRVETQALHAKRK